MDVLGKLHTYESLGLVGGTQNLRLDAVTRLACTVVGAPVAIVSVIQPDLDRQYLSSFEGLPDELTASREVPLELSICRHVQESGSPVIIEDLWADPRTADNPLIHEHGLRSYIGVPIHAVSGQSIGAMCCFKTETCAWTETQIETMLQLAGCVDDQIQLRGMQTDALKASRKLRAIAGARSGFVTHISHEIRTPLTGMVGSIRLLERMKLDGVAGDLVCLLNRTSLRLLDVVNDTLDLARMDAGSFKITLQDCDLHRIALDVVDSHRAEAARKGIEVRVTAEPSPLHYLVDRMALASVLDNLFCNAVKFTQAGCATIDLSRDRYGNIKIEVSDTGVGIPPALQIAIFDEFEQAGPRFARKYGGTGLGMAMVKRLIELMDGEIELDSNEGRGTTITIVLPLEAVDKRVVALTD